MATIEDLNISISKLDDITAINLIKRTRAERRVLPTKKVRKSSPKKTTKKKTPKKQLSLDQLYEKMTPEQRKILIDKLEAKRRGK